MFKIKSVRCYYPHLTIIAILLGIIIIMLSSDKPQGQYELDTDNVIRFYTPPTEGEWHEHPSQPKFDHNVVKDYQLEITDNGYQVIVFDGDRIVGALPLDNKCNLTNLILEDND